MAQEGHVKFAEGTHLEPEKVHVENDGSKYHLPEAHVGMLRNHHTYHADIPILHELGDSVVVEQPDYNLYIRCIEVGDTRREGERYVTPVTAEVKTIKEGRIREKLIVKSTAESEKQMEVLVTAQVMESNQGNPLLKDGVRLVSHEVEDESDWPGHSSHN